MAWYAKFDGLDGELVGDLSLGRALEQTLSEKSSGDGSVETTWKVEGGRADETLPGIKAGVTSTDPELAHGKAVIL